jgi:hypothetical protein
VVSREMNQGLLFNLSSTSFNELRYPSIVLLSR